MIIRLTVKDNDYNNLMNSFVFSLGNRISQIPSNIKELDINKRLEILDEINKIDRLLNPNVTENHTDEEKEIIINRIKVVFTEFVINKYKEDKSTAEYLIKNFDVQIIDSMEDKWENGEAWYWFQHSRIYLNQ